MSQQGHNFVKNGRNKNQKPHAHFHMIRRQSMKFQTSPMKDVRRVARTRSDGRKYGRTDRRTDGHTHGRTRIISIAPLRLRRVTKMEISAEKTKLMTNSANGTQREIIFKGQKLGKVTSFKYLGAIVSDEGLKPEVLSRIVLMRSLVIAIFLYACESWTLTES